MTTRGSCVGSWPRRSAPIRTRSGSAAKDARRQYLRLARDEHARSPRRPAFSPAAPDRAGARVPVALLIAAAPAHAMMMEANPQAPCQGHGDNPQSFLQAHDATVLRIGPPDFPDPNPLRCVERAKAEGYHVYLSLQYDNAWSPTRVASYFAQTLPPTPRMCGQCRSATSRTSSANSASRARRAAQGAGVHRRRTPAALPARRGRVLPAGVERGRAGAGSCHSEGSAACTGRPRPGGSAT